MERDTVKAQLEWDRKRLAILDAIVERDTVRPVDNGPDASGNFDVSPFVVRNHHVEVAPKELRLSPDSSFPKRIATQRIIDRYHRHKHITNAQWKAADSLWQLWCRAGLNARVAATYEGFVSSAANRDGPFAAKAECAEEYLQAMNAVPYRCRGCVTHVVILDWPASDWARGRGYKHRDSERHGMTRLRPGLDALAAHFGY